ncbi:MAG: tetratricopeptide repeat protein [Candidatus Contendobacter sp.]|nr:tetratricopeptide repeat protein [Candidatus Contendobacter sp.]
MKWRIDRMVHAPASALPLQERTWPATLALGRPLFTLTPAAADDDLSRTIGQAIGDPDFAVRWEQPEEWQGLPPPLWRGYLAETADPADPINARYGEIALTLRLLPLGEWQRNQPLAPASIREMLVTGGPLPQRLREAFAFALFEPNGPWDRDDEVLAGWTAAVRTVLHQRSPLERTLSPHSRWLARGYRLLETLSQLRDRRPALTEIETGWQVLQSVESEPLPQMFAVVYWGESAYRLLECGDTHGAGAALERQTRAAEALIAVLPDLAENLAGGLWRHHLGQLAYYRGDFPEALRHFQQEWRLRGQRRDSLSARLQRNLSNLLTDLGLLDSARQLIETSLTQQQASDEPEQFKTLGRLGEIQVRLGDYAAARTSYQESWHRQPPDRREGRTAVYLGHLALLENQLTKAEHWYQAAEQADHAQQITFNPYRVMGCMALAWRRADRAEVLRLWEQHKDQLDALGDEKVLPAAVAALPVALRIPDPTLASRYVERLLKANYLVETLYPLRCGAATPTQVEPWLQRIATSLQGWQRALNAAVGDIPELDRDEKGSPGQVAARIKQALVENDWAPLATDLARAFPMNLLERNQEEHPPGTPPTTAAKETQGLRH